MEETPELQERENFDPAQDNSGNDQIQPQPGMGAWRDSWAISNAKIVKTTKILDEQNQNFVRTQPRTYVPPPIRNYDPQDVIAVDAQTSTQKPITQEFEVYSTDESDHRAPWMMNSNQGGIRESRQIASITAENIPPPIPKPKKTNPHRTVHSTQMRVKFTEEEDDALLLGVKEFGIGKWEKILNAKRDSFHTKRTGVALKDRWRILKNQMADDTALDKEAVRLETLDWEIENQNKLDDERILAEADEKQRQESARLLALADVLAPRREDVVPENAIVPVREVEAVVPVEANNLPNAAVAGNNQAVPVVPVEGNNVPNAVVDEVNVRGNNQAVPVIEVNNVAREVAVGGGVNAVAEVIVMDDNIAAGAIVVGGNNAAERILIDEIAGGAIVIGEGNIVPIVNELAGGVIQNVPDGNLVAAIQVVEAIIGAPDANLGAADGANVGGGNLPANVREGEENLPERNEPIQQANPVQAKKSAVKRGRPAKVGSAIKKVPERNEEAEGNMEVEEANENAERNIVTQEQERNEALQGQVAKTNSVQRKKATPKRKGARVIEIEKENQIATQAPERNEVVEEAEGTPARRTRGSQKSTPKMIGRPSKAVQTIPERDERYEEKKKVIKKPTTPKATKKPIKVQKPIPERDERYEEKKKVTKKTTAPKPAKKVPVPKQPKKVKESVQKRKRKVAEIEIEPENTPRTRSQDNKKRRIVQDIIAPKIPQPTAKSTKRAVQNKKAGGAKRSASVKKGGKQTRRRGI